MYPFLILSSLSVGFYLVLLVALHRDSRRHSRMVGLRSNGSFNARTIHVLSTTIGGTSNRRNPNVSKVAVPTFFASNPIASGYPDQSSRPAHFAGLHQVRPSGDARPPRRESFHA
jgi:hypothetical protein